MGKGGGGDFKVLRKRDLAFLIILVLAIYISLDTTSFTYRLQPAWYYDQRAATESSHYHEQPWQMPPPLVVDLDGDLHQAQVPDAGEDNKEQKVPSISKLSEGVVSFWKKHNTCELNIPHATANSSSFTSADDITINNDAV